MKVKICGITTLEDALAAVEAGADLLGFNFYPKSPRCIAPDDCARIVKAIKGAGVVNVGVFVNAEIGHMLALLDACGLDLAQLSGDEPPAVVEALGERALKALRPASADDLRAALAGYPQRSSAPTWLLDAAQPGAYGGTGLKADWGLAAGLAARAPILLAGGLRPDNVAEAIRQVNPWGVDVASGVESAPGRKQPDLMEQLIRAARREQTHRLEPS